MLFNLYAQAGVLNQALQIAGRQADNTVDILRGYNAIATASLEIIDASEEIPSESKDGIRAMAYWMPGNIVLTGPDILHTIKHATWEMIGMTRSTSLQSGERAGVIGVIMAVSQSIIAAESARLAALADTDTALAEGWDA